MMASVYVGSTVRVTAGSVAAEHLDQPMNEGTDGRWLQFMRAAQHISQQQEQTEGLDQSLGKGAEMTCVARPI